MIEPTTTKGKKCLEWLEPLTLDSKEAKAFKATVSKKPSADVFVKQIKLFEVAKKLK